MGSREECLFNIEWEFPEYKGLPKATTRHLLKTESTSDISFSGGLDWVKKLLEQSVISSRDWTTTLTRTTITQPFPDFPFVVSYEPRTKKDHGDGQTSVYSEAPSATTSTTAASTDIPSNSSEMQNQNQNQTQHEFEPEIEALKQQWKQAKAFYARTGDMSEMGAVMARGNIILGLLSRTGGRGSEGCNCSLLSLRSIFYN